MLPSIEYIKTLVNGLKQWADNSVKSVRKELTDKVEALPRPNWEQNDENAKDYIENRPFYAINETFLGKMTFTANSETEMTHTVVYPYDENAVSGIYNLSGKGDNALKVVANGQSFLARVVFNYGNISLLDGISGSVYYSNNRVFTLTLKEGATSLIANNTYEVEFWSLIPIIIKIPGQYVGTDIFDNEDFLIRHGVGVGSIVHGDNTYASGEYAHAEGLRTYATGDHSHAKGINSRAEGNASSAEGYSSKSVGWCSHAEGSGSQASGSASHAEGISSQASGSASHAEGSGSQASGSASHAEGADTIASGTNSHVEGAYNIEDSSNIYQHIAGNGTSNSKRSNAHTLDWKGNAWFSGDVYTGSTSGTNRDNGSKKLATEEYVDSQKFSGSYNDLTDRPGGYIECSEVLSKTFAASDFQSAGDNLYQATFTPNQAFVVGNAYNVTCNGTKYEDLVAEELDGGILIGEIGDSAPGFTNYPFCIYVKPDGTNFIYQQSASAMTVLVEEQTVVKIPAKYLPGLPTATPFSIDSTASDYSTTSPTYGDQVKTALLAGRDVWYIGAETDESGKTTTKYTKVSWFNIEKTDTEAKLIVGVGARTDDNSGAVTFAISV